VSVVQVNELAAMTRQAYAAMWRFLSTSRGIFGSAMRERRGALNRGRQPVGAAGPLDASLRLLWGDRPWWSLGVVESGAAG
jgi:hypothetical protein